MKKYLSLFLVFLLIFTLAACGGGNDKNVTNGEKNNDKDIYTLGDFVLEYEGAKIAPDEDGFPSVIVMLRFTNNSDVSACYGFNMAAKAEQNGEFMYTAALNSISDDYYYKEATPGETIDVIIGYNLNAVDYQGTRNYTDAINVTIEDVYDGDSCTITIDPTLLPTVDNVLDDISDVDRTDTEVGGGFHGDLTWLRYWTGNWYGWWIMTNPTGIYAETGEGSWDACAYIEGYEDMTGYMELWDDEGSHDSLIAGIDLGFANPDDTEFGAMSCEGGQFLGCMLESGDWVIDPTGIAYDNIFDFSGEYSDEYGTFSYRVLLRPWGTLWDDLSEEYYPAHYYDWYLPLIEGNKPMPDFIG